MLNRRTFLRSTSLALGTCGLARYGMVEGWAGAAPAVKEADLTAADLPVGSAPKPVPFPHFPDRLHAFVWRNWQLVPARRMAEVVGASAGDIVRLGRSMGLAGPPRITVEQQRRAALSIIKRNWHLLSYEQLLQLLGWPAADMAFSLREDDFLFVKLGNLKPQCEPLRYVAPDARTQARAREIAGILRAEFPAGVGEPEQPLFEFVKELSRPPQAAREAQLGGASGVRPSPGAATALSRGVSERSGVLHGMEVAAPGDGRTPAQSPLVTPASDTPAGASAFSPRYCYSYFALYGDPLLDPTLDPYPDGYLARLAASGVDGVWLQAVLTRLAPFPWDAAQSKDHQTRLKNLRLLVERARRHGVRVYLYLNEPRACPVRFFATRPNLKGVAEGDFAALCTSVPEVREYLSAAVESICRAVPGLGGFFTISGSENLSNCWSHGNGKACPRCGKRPPAEVIAEVNRTFYEGIRRAGNGQTLIVWDWGWHDDWVESIIAQLPREARFMGVSEWGMPINRGGVATAVGEYSISTIGPGERARHNWEFARAKGLRTVAKVQCGCTWELSAVPYIPALANVARHAANLRRLGVNGLMLGWTLGGYPSPNLEVVAELGAVSANGATPDPDSAMARVAQRRFGADLAPQVVGAWREYSEAFSEFPFHGSLVYSAPMQVGPANPLWSEPTGYHASMVGFPYDDLDAWRAVYPPEVFIGQFEKVATGFEHAHANMAAAFQTCRSKLTAEQRTTALQELNVGEAAAIHFRSVANQARFVMERRRLKEAKSPADVQSACGELERLLRAEIESARRLHAVQSRDSRIGFEASNQYYYVPVDLAEKVINCQDLLTRWLPAERSRRG
jgi:hypothetical protein